MTRRRKRKIWLTAGIILGTLLLAYYFLFALPFRGQPFNEQRHGNPPLTPAWALECWLWEDDVNTARYGPSSWTVRGVCSTMTFRWMRIFIRNRKPGSGDFRIRDTGWYSG